MPGSSDSSWAPSAPAPADLLGLSRWSSCKSPPKPGKETNLLEDKSVGEGRKLGISPFSPSPGKCQKHPRRQHQGLRYSVETWFWDKQTFHFGDSKLNHKRPTQGDRAAGVSLGKSTSGEF